MKLWNSVLIAILLGLYADARRTKSRFQGFGRAGRKFPISTPPNVLRPPIMTLDPVTPATDDSNCLNEVICEPVYAQKFATLTGECNNRLDPKRGSRHRSFRRYFPGEYASHDGDILEERNGRKLPDARAVSNLMSGPNIPSQSISHMVPFWGQFITHDIVLTLAVGPNVDCDCYTPDDECVNARIAETDEQYNQIPPKVCFEIRRSFPVAKSENCDNSVHQQLNELSAFLDFGIVYGDTEAHSNALRDPDKSGELIDQLVRHATFGPILPQTDHSGIEDAGSAMFCSPLVRKPPNGIPCMVSGEARTNENSILMSHHTTWMRLHNNVVRKLKTLNSHWDSDTLYYNTRAIVGALSQRVTFGHFLPILLGPDVMKRFGLNLVDNGYYFGYDSSYDGTPFNEFATAALRMGHTLISNELSRPNPHWAKKQGETLTVSESLFNVGSIIRATRAGGPNSFLRGAMNDSALWFDPSFSNSLRNFLDSPPKPVGDTGPGEYGNDLFTINIQRGRDHGLANYLKYREFCGLKVASKSFNGLEDINRSNQKKLKKLYKNVHNIDLFVGGVSENPLPGALIGPTFACLLAHQFRDLKRGDRYYHENGGGVQVFNSDQLAAIRKATFPGLLCEIVTDMRTVQPFPMLQAGSGNERQSCEDFSSINVDSWKENEPGRPVGTGEPIIVQDYEWTHWFPTIYDGIRYTNPDVLSLLLKLRPSEVCTQVMGTETKEVNRRTLVRFQCLPGTIKYSDFPNFLSDEYYWTAWINDNKDIERDEKETSREGVCRTPIEFQAQTNDRIPAGETGDVFTEFGVYTGLTCEGVNQESGVCKNYRIRYLCRRAPFSPPPLPPRNLLQGLPGLSNGK